jgi:hypothetical protein
MFLMKKIEDKTDKIFKRSQRFSPNYAVVATIMLILAGQKLVQ